ncbi:hypothetical protein [Ornithinimicrobium sp. W1665]|uniref:hypothetical protein n=1 Tax=Ornithinimicrobium sp. W1665 TaxID=3416666 RepID=UPI003CEF92FE
MSGPFDLEGLDDIEPFEVDKQADHLFKHPHLGMGDVLDAWSSDPLFYPGQAASSLADARGSQWASTHRAAGSISIGRSEQVPTDRLLRGIFGPRRYVPEGP